MNELLNTMSEKVIPISYQLIPFHTVAQNSSVISNLEYNNSLGANSWCSSVLDNKYKITTIGDYCGCFYNGYGTNAAGVYAFNTGIYNISNTSQRAYYCWMTNNRRNPSSNPVTFKVEFLDNIPRTLTQLQINYASHPDTNYFHKNIEVLIGNKTVFTQSNLGFIGNNKTNTFNIGNTDIFSNEFSIIFSNMNGNWGITVNQVYLYGYSAKD